MITRIVLVIALLLVTNTSLFAQNNKGQLRALKTAFITNALQLTPSEAEKFWPVYNAFERKMREVKGLKTQQLTHKIKLAGGIDNMSVSEADKVLQEFIEIDFNVAQQKKKLGLNLSNIISSKKIIKLFWAEQEFTKELLKKLRERKKINSIKRN